jgi:hypothetical protein
MPAAFCFDLSGNLDRLGYPRTQIVMDNGVVIGILRGANHKFLFAVFLNRRVRDCHRWFTYERTWVGQNAGASIFPNMIRASIILVVHFGRGGCSTKIFEDS